MKLNFRILAMTVLLGGSILACKESFLETPPQGALAGETLSSSKAGVNATLVAAYKGLVGWTGDWSRSPWGTSPSNWVWNIASDDAHKGSEPGDGDGNILVFAQYQWQPSNGELISFWKARYEGIVRANSAIRAAKTFAETNASEKAYTDGVIGEALFLRAHYHFDLYKVFKNIPYYLEGDTDFRKPQEADALAAIIKDYEAAIALLPAKRDAPGRSDKMVATSFLGKAKLFKKDYAGALAAFNTVISSGRYKLSESFYDNFSLAGDNNDESIFALQASVNDGNPDGFNADFGARLALPHAGSPYGCCGFYQPTHDLAYAYRVDKDGLPIPVAGKTLKRILAGDSDELDPRMDYTMGRVNVPFRDYGIMKEDWVRGGGYQGWYNPKKNAHEKTAPTLSGSWTGTQLSGLNTEIMRYADLLLMAAECEVEVGSLAKAQEYVNAIRKRAGATAQGKDSPKVAIDSPEITWAKYKVSEYKGAWTNKDAARDAVRLERRLELAMEGIRIFDLQRWGNLESTIIPYQEREGAVVPLVKSFLKPTKIHYAFPIPSQEIDKSLGNLKQNEGF